MLDGHAGSAIKVLVAIHYSVLDVRNGYIRNVVVACRKSFICRGCLNPVTSVDIGASAKWISSVTWGHGDADAAAENWLE